MAAQEAEKAAKKKLTVFLNEMLKVGTVRGFKYFVMYMRGREEMICRVQNEPLTPSESEQNTPLSFSFSGSLNAANMPFDEGSLMLSARTQKSLSGFAEIDVGLPPASPVEREIAQSDDNSTLFLIAGYARYGCPYVWVRSNHERLVKLSGNESFNKDSPLKLKTTAHWSERENKIWDIMAELVKICTLPIPRNPFAVDIEYFDQLPLMERILATGAMANFLQKVLSCNPDKPYSSHVVKDLDEITKKHFTDMQTYVQQLKQQPSEVMQSHCAAKYALQSQQQTVAQQLQPVVQQQQQTQQSQSQQSQQVVQQPTEQQQSQSVQYNLYKSSGGLTKRAHAQYY
ncbi:uncharacterized protein LOC102805631 [Saccoglossus kowalevskii]|uniref:Alpha-protein kinase 1-like n=1 Tax=Saccoglossus kowalevskii TaxID=10224 RepID=A0ABM0MSY8_SACKO|nr:PREDICTED: alpha-protein kinase 1-like [Saccoglossus kowalevskii]